jgi:hypothetical protein
MERIPFNELDKKLYKMQKMDEVFDLFKYHLDQATLKPFEKPGEKI